MACASARADSLVAQLTFHPSPSLSVLPASSPLSLPSFSRLLGLSSEASVYSHMNRRCRFMPQSPLTSGDFPTSHGIPNTAWPHVTTILSTYLQHLLLNPNATPVVSTVDMGKKLDDASLVGVFVGLVRIAEDQGNGRSRKGQTLKRPDEGRGKEGRRQSLENSADNGPEEGISECIGSAVGTVEARRQVEGVLDLRSGIGRRGIGKVAFLLYKDD